MAKLIDKAKLIGIGIENFRVFKNYTEFEFAPITLLTGANSSGKSSLLKALLVLAVNAEENLPKFKLDFRAKNNIAKLGDFDSIRNSKKRTEIVFTLIFNNLYKEPVRPVHEEAIADIVFKELAITPTKIRFSFNASKNMNMNTFSYIITTKNKDIELFTFQFSDDFKTLRIKKIDYTWVEKFVTTVNKIKETKKEKNTTAQKDKKMNIEEDMSRLRDIYGVISLAFRTVIPMMEGKENAIHLEILASVIKELIENVFETIAIHNNSYLPATRGEQERSYDTSGHLPLHQLLAAFFENNFHRNSPEYEFIRYWLKKLGIGDDIELEEKEDRIFVNIIDGKSKRPLADYGLGVSQYLPILFNIVVSKPQILLIEEPENSLHPNFQSLLADVLIDAQTKFGIHFIVETHSEYLIRKLQYLTMKSTISTKDCVIYYFTNPNEVDEANGVSQLIKINIEENGSLTNRFGSGFYDEAAYWAFLLSNKTIR